MRQSHLGLRTTYAVLLLVVVVQIFAVCAYLGTGWANSGAADGAGGVTSPEIEMAASHPPAPTDRIAVNLPEGFGWWAEVASDDAPPMILSVATEQIPGATEEYLRLLECFGQKANVPVHVCNSTMEVNGFRHKHHKKFACMFDALVGNTWESHMEKRRSNNETADGGDVASVQEGQSDPWVCQVDHDIWVNAPFFSSAGLYETLGLADVPTDRAFVIAGRNDMPMGVACVRRGVQNRGVRLISDIIEELVDKNISHFCDQNAVRTVFLERIGATGGHRQCTLKGRRWWSYCDISFAQKRNEAGFDGDLPTLNAREEISPFCFWSEPLSASRPYWVQNGNGAPGNDAIVFWHLAGIKNKFSHIGHHKPYQDAVNKCHGTAPSKEK